MNNTRVTAETVSVTAKAASTLLISEKGRNAWKTLLPLTDNVDEMVPVSTIGSDGEALEFVKDSAWTTDNIDNKSYASSFKTAVANTDYYKGTFDIKSSVAGSKLYLDKETTFTPNTGANSDFLKTLRLGLVVSDNTKKKTFIYQVDTGTLASSYDTSIDSTTAVNGITKAIGTDGNEANINVDNTAAIGGLLLADTPTSTTAFVTETNSADLLYTFANSGDVVNVEVYIWMEGCDYDCNAAMVASITSQKVLAKLGFAVANA